MFQWRFKSRKKKKDAEIEKHLALISKLNHILSSFFHEIAIPLMSLGNEIDHLSAFVYKNGRRDFKGIISDYERIQAILTVHLNEYRGDDFWAESEGGYSDYKLVSVNTVVETAIKTIKYVFPEIHFVANYSARCTIECLPFEVVQGFINLFKNAYEAYLETTDKPVIYIKTGREKNFDRSMTVIVEIEDHATGIDPIIINKIWEDGYTTKRKDKFNQIRGVGLPIVRATLGRYAKITVESPVQQKNKEVVTGTKFTMRFKS